MEQNYRDRTYKTNVYKEKVFNRKLTSAVNSLMFNTLHRFYKLE